jgi:hypothetical protein
MSKDKKQLVVVGVLVLVVLAIGAFQFMGMRPKPVAKEDEPKKEDKGEIVAQNDVQDPVKTMVEQLTGQASMPRNPFEAQAVVLEDEKETTTQPDPEITNGNGNVGRPPNGYKSEIGVGGFGGAQVEPVDPTNGNGLNGNSNITNGQPVQYSGDAPYILRGVIIGRKTMCMLQDAKGRDHLVREGENVPGTDHTILSITQKEIKINYQGRVRTLVLAGGN